MKTESKLGVSNAPRGTAAAPLLYWLTVICGLAGITILRLDDERHVVPIWFGSIVGLALGQLLAVLRIRVWTATLAVVMSSWLIGPAVYLLLGELFGFGADTDMALMTLLPAFVCGYASLTERGGLLAFWYPAMLWMLVILDGEAADSFAPRAYLPMAVGLGVMFIAFLRARETRRVALWKAYGSTELATPAPDTILRASPMAGLAQLAWTTMVGGGVFLIAAFVAPNLWKKDHALHQKAAQVPPPVRYDATTSLPCCPESWRTEKVKEYIALKNEHDAQRVETNYNNCSYCPPPEAKEEMGPYAMNYGSGVRVMGVSDGYYWQYGYNHYDPVYHYYRWQNNYAAAPSYDNTYAQYDYNRYDNGYNPSAQPPVYNPAPVVNNYVPPQTAYTYTPPVIDPPKPIIQPKPVVKPVAPVATQRPVVHAPVTQPVAVSTPKTPKPAATPPVKRPEPKVVVVKEDAPPWGFFLPFLASIVLIPLAWRFLRRQVTLRHLTSPFWTEPVDQRISNHWQRMLVGLRDAGIQLRVTEQPAAFAKRVKIAGMETCATILERVRHGVRIEDADIREMNAATNEVYETSRKKAGVAGRVAAAFRWPLV
jgi:hypothetical protein